MPLHDKEVQRIAICLCPDECVCYQHCNVARRFASLQSC